MKWWYFGSKSLDGAYEEWKQVEERAAELKACTGTALGDTIYSEASTEVE